MRILQNVSVYPGYLPRLRGLAPATLSFAEQVRRFVEDRYASSHVLLPVVQSSPDAFLTNAGDTALQAAWGREHGLRAQAGADEILLAQIEQHRTEVFYNLDPIRFDDRFLRRLPGCVRKTIAWRAAPSPHLNFRDYDLLVCNFPDILRRYAEQGFRTAEFFPAHDEVMNAQASNQDRPIDVLFVGGYSRHHQRRAGILEEVARLADRHRIRYCLDRSRLTRLAESPVGLLPPLRQHRRPAAIRRVAESGVFGIDLYRALGQAKIALNAAVDMAGDERGNMRCFEAMGCGSLLLSDEGRYPRGMEPGRTLITYADGRDARRRIESLLDGEAQERQRVAAAGFSAISREYSRERQWDAFVALCS